MYLLFARIGDHVIDLPEVVVGLYFARVAAESAWLGCGLSAWHSGGCQQLYKGSQSSSRSHRGVLSLVWWLESTSCGLPSLPLHRRGRCCGSRGSILLTYSLKGQLASAGGRRSSCGSSEVPGLLVRQQFKRWWLTL